MAASTTTCKAQQERYLEALRQNPSLSVSELSRQLGLDRERVYKWRTKNTNNFRERQDAVLKEVFDSLEGKAIKCMEDLIDEGSFQAAKYVLDNKGYAATQKIDLKSENEIKINIE